MQDLDLDLSLSPKIKGNTRFRSNLNTYISQLKLTLRFHDFKFPFEGIKAEIFKIIHGQSSPNFIEMRYIS